MDRIAREQPEDSWEVEHLYDLCFAPGREALSSYRLREGVERVRALCLTARDESGFLGGAVRVWPVRIVAGDGAGTGARETCTALLLGPIAVHPTRQGEGLGGALMRDVHARAEALGWVRILLVGDAAYYSRFGYERLAGVRMPPPTNPDRVLGRGDWTGCEGDVQRGAVPGENGPADGIDRE
jgi:predicted N-acetyltransferase YhbS